MHEAQPQLTTVLEGNVVYEHCACEVGDLREELLDRDHEIALLMDELRIRTRWLEEKSATIGKAGIRLGEMSDKLSRLQKLGDSAEALINERWPDCRGGLADWAQAWRDERGR